MSFWVLHSTHTTPRILHGLYPRLASFHALSSRRFQHLHLPRTCLRCSWPHYERSPRLPRLWRRSDHGFLAPLVDACDSSDDEDDTSTYPDSLPDLVTDSGVPYPPSNTSSALGGGPYIPSSIPDVCLAELGLSMPAISLLRNDRLGITYEMRTYNSREALAVLQLIYACVRRSLEKWDLNIRDRPGRDVRFPIVAPDENVLALRVEESDQR
ncbi:hypothetical protein B0H14DRAFT_2640592 [Mycena olivaceomarginata]|nr:hypothetical protein B0H14DRAFT_2640592 [Mycena olivaceomarginata]